VRPNLTDDVPPQVDVFLAGTVFLDIIFTGLPTMPAPGTEVWAAGMGSSPGGIANLAVASSRLGLRTALGAAFGDDAYADFCWRTLAEQERVDLSHSRRFGDWHTPVTVSLAVDRDRSMVTHEHPAPMGMDAIVGDPPSARAAMIDIAPGGPSDRGLLPDWVRTAHDRGTLVFADVGWDPAESWPGAVLDELRWCHAFTPNAVEAMGYTRTATPADAVSALAELVPLAVVTDGPRGVIAIDSSTGERAHVPALEVEAIDPTGAGDVFSAALARGTLAGWPLAQRLAFAACCAALAVQHFGGSLAAPGWGDVADWWAATKRSGNRELIDRYAFLPDVLPRGPVSAVRRAAATIARHSDAAAGAHQNLAVLGSNGDQRMDGSGR
jgi:sugar/nucleoside kinase (ribokinase family)